MSSTPAAKRKANTEAKPKKWFGLQDEEIDMPLDQSQPHAEKDDDSDPAPILDIKTFRINFPFTLLKTFKEGRTKENAKRAREVLEAKYDEFLEGRKKVDDLIRTQMERLGSTYTINDHINSMRSDPIVWEHKVKGWIEEEKKARMASATDLIELKKSKKSKNPLIKTLLEETVIEPELITQEKEVEGGDKDKDEEEEEEEQLIIRGKNDCKGGVRRYCWK